MTISDYTLERLKNEAQRIANLTMVLQNIITQDNENECQGDYQGTAEILCDRMDGLYRELADLYAQSKIKEEHVA